jgi:hypothetical protein
MAGALFTLSSSRVYSMRRRRIVFTFEELEDIARRVKEKNTKYMRDYGIFQRINPTDEYKQQQKARNERHSQIWDCSSEQQSRTRPITASVVTFRAAVQQVSEDTMARRVISSSSNILMVSFVLISIIWIPSTTLICNNISRAKPPTQCRPLTLP